MRISATDFRKSAPRKNKIRDKKTADDGSFFVINEAYVKKSSVSVGKSRFINVRVSCFSYSCNELKVG